MAVNARLNQITAELFVLPSPHAKLNQIAVELFVLPAIPPPPPTLPVRITLRGAKLVPVGGSKAADCECPEPEHVKRAV